MQWVRKKYVNCVFGKVWDQSNWTFGKLWERKKMPCFSVQWGKMCLHICLTKRFHFLFWIFSQGFKSIYKLRSYYSIYVTMYLNLYIYKRCHCSLYQSSWWDIFGFVWLCFLLFLQVFVCCFLLCTLLFSKI